MKSFLLVNAGSGGGNVQDPIIAAASNLGIDFHVAQPGDDFTAVVEQALADGADCLGAAGGDGTLSAVADVAVAHAVPMIAVPAGTRNHFALDLGLDIEDPVRVLIDAVRGGYRRRVDLGTVNGATFLNNVSVGTYATAVTDPDYRSHRARTLVKTAREAADPAAGQSAHLSVRVPGTSVVEVGEATVAVLVSNNAYAPTFAPGKRLRPRLDAGEVWVYVGGGLHEHKSLVAGLADAAHRVAKQSAFRAVFAADRIVLASDRADVPIAVDGEARPDLQAPFELVSRAGALTLLVPDDPGPRDLDVHLAW